MNICKKSDALPAELRSPPSRDCRESNIILANVHTSNEILILLSSKCSKCYKYQLKINEKEPWDLGFLEWSWGIPREAPGISERPRRSPERSLEAPKGSRESRELGFPEVRDPLAAWMGWLGWLGSMEGPMGY